VLDPARRPIRPTGIARIQVNAAATGLGLLVGLLVAAILEFRDTSFRFAEEVKSVFQLPVIALVPSIATDVERRHTRRKHFSVAVVAIVVSAVGGYGVWALELWRYIT
jgi:hypothetical protein